MKYGNFEVYAKESAVGEAQITEEGIRTRIKCSAKYESDDVLRLAADVGERYEYIGVMMPREDGLFFEKTFTKNDLYAKNLHKTVRYVLVSQNETYEKAKPEEKKTDERVWSGCADPMKYFDDVESGAALSRFDGVLKSEKEGITYIAVPIDREKPFPALPIFYFGQRESLHGEEFVVFALKDGQLLI